MKKVIFLIALMTILYSNDYKQEYDKSGEWASDAFKKGVVDGLNGLGKSILGGIGIHINESKEERCRRIKVKIHKLQEAIKELKKELKQCQRGSSSTKHQKKLDIKISDTDTDKKSKQ